MVRIKFDMIDFRMTMDGHAAAPREGEFDLVCCAASVLGQQLLYSLEEFQEKHNGLEKIDTEMEPGHLMIRAKAKEWARAGVKRRMEYCREGMEMLEDRYPEYIRVEEEDDGDE